MEKKIWNGNKGFELATSLEIHINRREKEPIANIETH